MSYSPEGAPRNGSIDDLAAYIDRELSRVGNAFNSATLKVEMLAVEPMKPRDGLIAGADGVNWDPGSGEGIYVWFNGVWNLAT